MGANTSWSMKSLVAMARSDLDAWGITRCRAGTTSTRVSKGARERGPCRSTLARPAAGGPAHPIQHLIVLVAKHAHARVEGSQA